MNSIIGSEVIKTASSMGPIVTPISSIISATKPASMVESAGEASTAAAVATSSTAQAANVVANGERFILGISQRNLIIGAAVMGTAAVLGGGYAFYRHKKTMPKMGIVIKLNEVPVKNVSINLVQPAKVTHSEKKDGKDLLKAIGGVNDMNKVIADLKQIADSDTKELLDHPIDKFPDTNIVFNNVGDRVAMGIAIINKACFNARGYRAEVTYVATEIEAEIRVTPFIGDKAVTEMEQAGPIVM